MKIQVLLDRYRLSKNELVLAKVRVRKIHRELRVCHKKWRAEQTRWEVLRSTAYTVGLSTPQARADTFQARQNCTKLFPSKVHRLHMQLFEATDARDAAKSSARQAVQAIRQIQAGIETEVFDEADNAKPEPAHDKT